MEKPAPFALFRRLETLPNEVSVTKVLRKSLNYRNGAAMLRDFILLILFFVFVVAWLVLWLAAHIAGGLVHLLLVVAIIFLILHFVRGRRTTV